MKPTSLKSRRSLSQRAAAVPLSSSLTLAAPLRFAPSGDSFRAAAPPCGAAAKGSQQARKHAMDEETRTYLRAVRLMVTMVMEQTKSHLDAGQHERIHAVFHPMAPATWTDSDTKAAIRRAELRTAAELDIPPWD